jgi:hypothetical protein
MNAKNYHKRFSLMKQIFYGFLALCVGLSACSSSPDTVPVGKQRVFRITQADSAGRMFSQIWTKPRLESLGAQEILSEYFDRAMHRDETHFSAVAFSRLLQEFKLIRGEDAVLLNCFDDYQGVLPLQDILRYDLRLATKIKLSFGSRKPDWLNPLLILVPDGKHPPFQEQFMTANIREIKFVRLNDYYAPLKEMAGTSVDALMGFEAFKDNCLFCHSLMGKGGNKGVRLLDVYDFSVESGRIRMREDFNDFHDEDNDQDIKQFVTARQLKGIVTYLKKFAAKVVA